MKRNQLLRSLPRGLAGFFISLFGIIGWLLQSFLQLLTGCLILGALIALLIYAKVKPDLDYCREVAYDKLAQMQRQDFQLLSDTEVYDKNNQLIGLINAGHYEYVPIKDISMNLQNAYIAQEDRRFKSHTGVDWIATFRAGLALVKNRGEITQGGSTITQQVIKNTYLTQEQSFTRKIVEILLAPEVEKNTPRQILWSSTATPTFTATTAMESRQPAVIILERMPRIWKRGKPLCWSV